MSGILSDTAIIAAIRAGEIEIDPFNPEHVNITSYDLTLGDEVRVYSTWVSGTPLEFTGGSLSSDETFQQGLELHVRAGILDSRVEPVTEAWKFNERGFVLRPGVGYLMHTRETVWTDRYNPVLDGKSSIGRLFIQCHSTAGFGDPGFCGQYTLEVIVQHPVRVYPGMRIAQLRFHTVHGRLSKLYNEVGHYVGDSALGAGASQAWKQFRK
jgi:dCTP deaminase